MEKKLYIAFFAFLAAGLGLIGVKSAGNALVSADTTASEKAASGNTMTVLIVVATIIFVIGGWIAIRSWLSRHRHQ